MKIAVISDLHGNAIALEKVLIDIKNSGAKICHALLRLEATNGGKSCRIESPIASKCKGRTI